MFLRSVSLETKLSMCYRGLILIESVTHAYSVCDLFFFSLSVWYFLESHYLLAVCESQKCVFSYNTFY